MYLKLNIGTIISKGMSSYSLLLKDIMKCLSELLNFKKNGLVKYIYLCLKYMYLPAYLVTKKIMVFKTLKY